MLFQSGFLFTPDWKPSCRKRDESRAMNPANRERERPALTWPVAHARGSQGGAGRSRSRFAGWSRSLTLAVRRVEPVARAHARGSQGSWIEHVSAAPLTITAVRRLCRRRDAAVCCAANRRACLWAAFCLAPSGAARAGWPSRNRASTGLPMFPATRPNYRR